MNRLIRWSIKLIKVLKSWYVWIQQWGILRVDMIVNLSMWILWQLGRRISRKNRKGLKEQIYMAKK